MANREHPPVNQLEPVPAGDAMHTTIPGMMPVAAPFESQRPDLPTAYPVVPRAMVAGFAPGIEPTGARSSHPVAGLSAVGSSPAVAWPAALQASGSHATWPVTPARPGSFSSTPQLAVSVSSPAIPVAARPMPVAAPPAIPSASSIPPAITTITTITQAAWSPAPAAPAAAQRRSRRRSSRPKPPRSIEPVQIPGSLTDDRGAALDDHSVVLDDRALDDHALDDHAAPTLEVPRQSHVRMVIGRLVLPTILLLIGGVAIGGFVALRGRAPAPVAQAPSVAGAAPAAAPAGVAPPPVAAAPAAMATAPAAAPTVAVTPAAVTTSNPPALVDVRIESTPSGATVMLVDRGRAQLVGNTPIVAAVDPSRDYDLVFSYPDKAVLTQHLDARVTQRVAVNLGRAGRPRPAAAPRRSEPAVAVAPASKPDQPRDEPRSEDGTLMISSKPPCEIVIDGKPTGLSTPQRSITLSAGHHIITLVNHDRAISKTVGVQITADATAKVIEDLMR